MGMLDGKVAIITGATSGIGERAAELFVEEGALIVFTGRRKAQGEAVAKRLGANASFVAADATDEADWERLIRHVLERHGRLDALFNNAGGPGPTGGIETIPVDGFDRAMAQLVRSVMLGMKHAAPVMKRQRAGSIINNGSIAAHLAGYSSSMIYSAAKAAVVHLSTCVAMQLGESKVRVNCISPGGIATGIFGKALGLPTEAAESTAEAMKAGLAKLQPVPRAGLTDDIANAAVFLASDAASFINGHNLVVDGGLVGGRQWSVAQQSYRGMKQAFGLE